MAKGKGGFLGQDGLNAPDQATYVTASGGDSEATVSFTAPENTGATAITEYRAQSSLPWPVRHLRLRLHLSLDLER